MRIAPFILICLGIFGIIYPEKLLEAHSGGGRWVFIIILALGILGFWRLLKKEKQKQ